MTRTLMLTATLALLAGGCATHEDGLSRPTRDAIRAGGHPNVSGMPADTFGPRPAGRGGAGWVRIDHYGATARTQRGQYGYLESRGIRATVQPTPDAEP